jgi:16S rRNA (guanine(966)-N(2))-methyltransferase RsmD
MVKILEATQQWKKLRSGFSRRPTTARVKKSIFDIIKNILDGAKVLELFAGTGSFGLECLQRGAEEVVFVDIDARSGEIINQSLISRDWQQKGRVLRTDYRKAIRRLEAQKKSFDLIFLDPPYATSEGKNCLNLLASSRLFNFQTVIILEHASGEDYPCEINKFSLSRRKNYGSTTVSFYEVKND